MKETLRRLLAGLLIHLILSCTLLGGIRVFQQSYNTTHREPIRMASLRLSPDTAELSLLGRSCRLPLTLLREESPLYLAAYCVMDGGVWLWICVVHEIETIYSQIV